MAALTVLKASPACAATYYWDTDKSSTGNNVSGVNIGASGGAAAWSWWYNTPGKVFWTGSGADVSYFSAANTGSDDVVFNGTSGAVYLYGASTTPGSSDTLHVRNMTVGSAGYTFVNDTTTPPIYLKVDGTLALNYSGVTQIGSAYSGSTLFGPTRLTTGGTTLNLTSNTGGATLQLLNATTTTGTFTDYDVLDPSKILSLTSVKLDLAGWLQEVNGLTGNSASEVTSSAVSQAGLLILENANVAVPTFAGNITGNLQLQNLTGTQIISGANTYSGGTFVLGGKLQAGATNTLPVSGSVAIGASAGSGAGILDLAGFSQIIQGLTTTSGNTAGANNLVTNSGLAAVLTLSNSTATTYAFPGTIGGAISLVKLGSGTQTLSGPNAYSGSTTIANGTLKLAAANTLPAATALIFGAGGTAPTAGILDLNASSQTVASLNEAATSSLNTIRNSGSSAAVLTIAGATASTFGGSIGSGGSNLSLAKTGASVMTLTGTNTYTGTTTVSAGSLYVNGTHTGGAGYTFTGTLGGNGSISCTVVADTGSGTLAPGPDASTVGNLTVAAFTLNANSTLQIKLNAPTANTATADSVTTTSSGTMYLDGAAISLVGLNTTGFANDQTNTFIIVNNTDPGATTHGQLSFNGALLADGDPISAGGTTFHIYYGAGDGNDVEITDVPEPGSMVAALVVAATMRRPRRFQRLINAMS